MNALSNHTKTAPTAGFATSQNRKVPSKVQKPSPSMDSLTANFESLNASEKTTAFIKCRPRDNPFVSRTTAPQGISVPKLQILHPPNKLEWIYNPTKQYVAQRRQESDPVKIPESRSMLNSNQNKVSRKESLSKSLVKRSITPRKVSFQNEFETEV